MANTYTWSVENMSTMPTPETDFVVSIFWTFTGTDGTNTASKNGITYTAQIKGDEFTPFADLTKNQVLKWVQDYLGEEGINSLKVNVDGQINSMANTIVTPTVKPLPW